MRRRAPTLVLALVLTVSALLAVAAPAAADSTARPDTDQRRVARDAPPVYLALGDSVAFGIGASNPWTTGYVPVLHRSLREQLPCPPQAGCPELRLRNLSIPGAETGTLISYQLPLAVFELVRRNWDAHPGNDVKVVTIDIGGNDLFGALASCQSGLPPTAECVEAVRSRLATFEKKFTNILRMLRLAGGPRTEIVAMTYYNPLPGCHLATLTPLGAAALEGHPELAEAGLNDLIRSISAGLHVHVAETYGVIQPANLVGGQDCLHPNDTGHHLIAHAFTRALGPSDQ